MSNICCTTYICRGDKKELREFKNILNKNAKRKTSKIGGGIGWLGNIIAYFGFDYNDYSPCRGEIYDYEMNGGELKIEMDTAWCEQEGFRRAIIDKFPGIKVYYIAEEPGCCVYETNSFEVFPERYLIESLDFHEYFTTLEEAKDVIEDVVGKKIIGGIDEINKAIKDYNEVAKGGDYLKLYEFKEVEDD